jgi:phage terminase small subunit
MPILPNTGHEQFAQSIAQGISATGAYIAAGYSKDGAAASASRLMTHDKVAGRIQELKTAQAAKVVKIEIRKRSARVQAGQNLVDRLCRLRDARAAEYADHPGGATGMLVKEYRGKNGQQEIWRFDAALVRQTNATLKQVAIEEGQWSEQRPLSDRQAATRTGGTVLDNTRHELFAQSVATGTSATAAYTSAGYSEEGAAASASRLLTDPKVAARVEELRTSIAEGVVEVDIRRRAARVEILETNLNSMFSLIEARGVEYADHPGGATGMLVKDYRGKNAEQEMWKFDASLVTQINATLKQAAIEEGQWSERGETARERRETERERRETARKENDAMIIANLHAGRQRVVDAKKAALAKGEPWPPEIWEG